MKSKKWIKFSECQMKNNIDIQLTKVLGTKQATKIT
jgi:hypothetical protein